ncbi:FxsA family protein [Moraxella bovis]|uniref:FxsA family protein n=1 Tax=Moraxella bovis TaxID=476 RepID=A0AAQ2Q2J9_MORBO|nr:FxsA family protein [Moraxella bovis]AWY21046.1 FxsA family protein [Moraxella bovis]UYZ68986.1 FxsA family protein [Moraxella bovis]UYZ71360.1 FxsA family protein [Moraxella bovis]UYZ72727.1 FxsA family protein [Moraxella bovis]UYZ76287.1 FxsA family protein [Moraxella bovis]
MGVVVGIALVWFIIEMLIWYLLAQFMSGWLVFLWFVVAFFIGLALIKKAASTLNPMAQQMKNGVIPNPANQPPESTITKSVAMGIAGILFVLPGILTDIGAFLLLLPAIQKVLTTKAKNYAMNNQEKMMAMMAKQMGGQSPFGGMGGVNPNNPFGQGNPFGNGGFGGNYGNSRTTIDGQAKTVKKSANDD